MSETRGNNTTPEGPSAMAEAAALLERAQLALRKVDLDSVRLSSEFNARIAR